MRILFIGQRGIPVLSRAAGRERRVEALAELLAAAGHEVTVSCAQPFISPLLTRYNGVRLRHLFSLNPNIPGGWIHVLLELWLLWRTQPAAVHLHGWRQAAVAPMAVLLAPEATFVWTVDSIPTSAPRWLLRLVARAAASAVDTITTPSRLLQYRLRNELGVMAAYVSDGYTAPALANLPVRRWGLRVERYCITTAIHPREVRGAAKAMRQTKSRAKLVVMADAAGSLMRLVRQFPDLRFVGPQAGRSRASLLRQAAAVWFAGHDALLDDLLQAMDSGRAIMATTETLYEETLGVSARFVQADDVEGLAAALTMVLRSRQARTAWGVKARRRARLHFSWQRNIPEYLELYSHPYSRSVPVDSVLEPARRADPSFAPVHAGR